MKEEKVKDLFHADPTMPIVLYQLDLKERGLFTFHAGENEFRGKIAFDGIEYLYYPIEVQGFEFQGDGRLPRPTMTLSNYRGNVSVRLPIFNDFINYRVTRIKTLLKYLDHSNFPNTINPYAEPDPEEAFAREIYFVNQKLRETDDLVEFELVSPLELENSTIPSRTIYSNYCEWKYRSTVGCGYVGKPVADLKNQRFVKLGYEGEGVGAFVYLNKDDFPDGFAEPDENGSYPEWTAYGIYNKGDVVTLTPKTGTSENQPISIYVCIGEEVISNPLFDKENWAQDQCDKTICGCRIRYSDDAKEAGGCKRFQSNQGDDDLYTEFNEGLPFGGFPGVEPYDFE